jgi:hypothetical protein
MHLNGAFFHHRNLSIDENQKGSNYQASHGGGEEREG